MTVLVTTAIPLDLSVYDQIIAGVGPLLQTAPGFRTHAVHSDQAGFVVTEIWDSEAEHQSFFAANVEPSLPPGVSITTTPLHNTLLAGAATAPA
jgi:hypothetical protein